MSIVKISYRKPRLELHNTNKTLITILTDRTQLSAYNIVLKEKINETSELTFSMPFENTKLNYNDCEKLIKFQGEYYIIKEISLNDNDTRIIDVTCQHEAVELKGVVCQPIDIIGATVDAIYQEIVNSVTNVDLSNYVWGGTDIPSTTRRHLTCADERSVFENLLDLAEVFDARVEFKTNSFGKIEISIKKEDINNGKYIKKGKDLKYLNLRYNSEEIFTRLVPYGATDSDGIELNILSVNNGKSYVEDYSYYLAKGMTIEQILKNPKCTQIKVCRYSDIVDANDLLQVAKDELAKYCVPQLSGNVGIVDLSVYEGNLFTPPVIAENIKVINKDINFILNAKIIGVERNYDNPLDTKIEISNLVKYNSVLKDLTQQGDKIDKITDANGNITEGALKKPVSVLVADKVDTKELNATVANIEDLIATNITAINADIKNLKVDKADITDLTAINIKFDIASGGVLDLQTLLSKFITGENGQFLNLTTDNVTISDAVIKDLIAKNISAEDLKAGNISTNKFNISSDDGGIEIVGATQQFKDKNNKVRIQMGQDAQGNFNFILRGEDGTTTLIDHTGIKEKAIADKLIKSNMVADNAIGEQQINYSSLVTGLNKDTNTSLIQSSKVAIDLTGQSLDIAFNTLKTNVEGLDEKTESNTTAISAIQGNIKTLIKDTTIEKDGVTTKLKDAYSVLDQTVSGINTTVASQTTSIGNLTTDLSSLSEKVTTAETSITQLNNKIALKVEKTDIEKAINSAKLSRADFISRNFLSTPLIVSDPTLDIYAKSGIPNPPVGAVFGSYNQKDDTIKNSGVSSNGTSWAIIIGYEFYNNTTDEDKKLAIKNRIKQVADFMCSNVSVGRLNSMNFNFIDTNYKLNATSGQWEKGNYKEIYISTMWLQVKAMIYAYEILQDERYLNLGLDVLDSLFNAHFHINNKVKSGELPAFLEWASYEYLACDNLSSNKRFAPSIRQYANQMGYYIHQAIRDVIRVVGDSERTTPKGDKYKPSDILKGLKKYLKNAYETQNITAMPLGLPYGYYHMVDNGDGSYSYLPQNWDFINNTWGDSWFVGDVVTYTIYSFAASGLTDIAREYANNYYKLRVVTTDSKWANRFSNSELLFYDRMDFNTGTHLEGDESVSITYTALFYEILKEIGLNEYIDACCYTLAKHQVDDLSNKNIDGSYPWDVSKDNASLEFKSLGEIINSKFYKNLNITSFSSIDNKLAEIEVTTNSITTKVSSTENKVLEINGNISSLQSRMYSAEQKITDSAIISTVQAAINDAKTDAVSQATSLVNQSANSILSQVNTRSKLIAKNSILTGDFTGVTGGSTSTNWTKNTISLLLSTYTDGTNWGNFYTTNTVGELFAYQDVTVEIGKPYEFSCKIAKYSLTPQYYCIRIQEYIDSAWVTKKEFTGTVDVDRSNPLVLYTKYKPTVSQVRIWIGKTDGNKFDIYATDFQLFYTTDVVKSAELKILDDKIETKVSESNVGTVIQQNAYSVKIAWNKISNYVQFENGGLSIYNGAVSTSQKRAVFNENGNHFWRDGYYLGKIGTNQYSGDASIKGIVFDLEADGGYMTWAVKKYSADSTYSMMWTYTNKTVGSYSAGMLHAGCDIDMHYKTLRNVNFEGGGITGTMNFVQIVGMNTSGTATKWYNNCKLGFQNGILIDATWGNV